MPRADPDIDRHCTRAYHRALAALRDRHREEWATLRQFFLDNPADLGRKIPAGPARGRKPQSANPNLLRERLHEFFHVGSPSRWACKKNPAECELYRTTVDPLIVVIGEALNGQEQQSA